ncbi:MAG: hypothetical protein A2284_10185 [Deltaproteobacteria bacterium RIFOXYA12_FULL_61_11]|nr:MAG: hypothetical protein A2284_10185 [Deltaproteobacteria bacterium RIFOXYA12_FULL_61_11]
MNQRSFGNCTLRVQEGDITDLEVEAFVFACRDDLELGTGFGTAISMRGGPKIQEELRTIGHCAKGDAVVTRAGDLKASYIIHANGPKFQETELENKLAAATRASLVRARERKVKNVAFPALCSGFYGVSADLCAKVMLQTACDEVQRHQAPAEVIFCLRDERELGPFRAELAKLEVRP